MSAPIITGDLQVALVASLISLAEYTNHRDDCPIKGAVSWDEEDAAFNAAGCTCGLAKLDAQIEMLLQLAELPKDALT